jgi:hypothetical protein
LCAALAVSASTGIAGAQQDEGDYAFAQHLMRDKMYDLASQQLQQFVTNYPNSARTADHVRPSKFQRNKPLWQIMYVFVSVCGILT